MQRQVCALLALCFAAFPAFAAVTGIVMTTDGQPVAGARVWVRPLETSEQRVARLLSADPELIPIAAVQTDAKGAFSIESPKQPVVDLAISAAGYEPLQRRIERDEEVGAIALTKAETRTATVTANGKPVAGAWVILTYNGFDHLVKTDEQGRYQAPDPKRVGSWVVLHPGYAILQGSPQGTPGTASDLNFKLTPGTSITGKVVGADDAPVAGATLLVDSWPVATSGEDGTFTIAHAPARWTTLTARKDSLLAQRAFTKDAAYTLKLAKGATVSGRVTDTKTKMPIAGATITLSSGGMRLPRGSSTTLVTDAKGAFSTVVAPGSYMLWPLHPSYMGSSAADIAAVAGQTASKDLSLLQAARVSGVVVDESKNPVVAASISPQSPDAPFMGGMRVMNEFGAVSGPDGRFSMRVEQDREIALRAMKKGLPTVKSETLRLSSGERKTGVVLVIPSGIAVSGRVTDAQGEPLSGVAVTATEAEGGRGGMMTRVFMLGRPQRDDDAVRTASDGTFTLRVKEGTYDFSFRRDGFAPKLVAGQVISPTSSPAVETSLEPAVEITGRVTRNGAGIENARVTAIGASDSSAVTGPDGAFTVGGLGAGPARLMVRKEDEFISEMRNVEAPARDVVIEVRAGGRVSGRVVEKGSSKPVTAFQAGISMSRGGGPMMMMGPPQLRDFTSEDGTFVLENVPAGAMTLVVNAPGYASGRMNVTVEEGKALSDIEVGLDTGVKLIGRVTAPNGQALSDVSVTLAPSPTGNFAASGMRRSATTDSNGEYVLDSLEAGEETIMFSHAKHAPVRKQVTLKGRETRLDLQLTAGQKITGTVVTEGGAPVADAAVELRGGGFAHARTDASGTFELESVNAGRYTVVASKTGYAEGRVEDYDATSGAPLRIVMRTGGSIYGRVTGVSPKELAMVEVQAFGNRTQASASVDAQGNYRIDGAPTGSVQVHAMISPRATMGAGYRTTRSHTLQVEPGSSQQVDLEFRGDVTVRGRITRNGQVMRGGSIMFHPKASDQAAASGGTIDDQGQYSVTGLEDGVYDVSISDMQRGYAPYHTTYTVRGSGTFDVDYKMGMVRGRVLDAANGDPIANVSVQLRSTTTPDFRGLRGGVTDSTGAFVIDSVPPGTYTATATKDGYGNQVTELMVGESALDNVELRLARNDGVVLKVVDARDGRPIAAQIVVYDMQGRVVHESRMSFLMGGGADATELRIPVSPGAYTASVSAMNYAPRNISFQSPSTQSVALSPGGSLQVMSKHNVPRRVRLLDANGIAYPRYAWSITQARDLLPSPAATTYTNVAAGSYTLQLVDENNNVLESKQVVVQDGQTSTVEI